MSVRCSTWVWDHSQARGNGLVVALKLADLSDDEGRSWPSVEYLAAKARMSERSCQDNLGKLETLGELWRQYRQGRSTMYHLLMGRTVTQVGGADAAPPHGAASAPRGCEQPHPGGAASRTHTRHRPATDPSAPQGVPQLALLAGQDVETLGTTKATQLVVAAWVEGAATRTSNRPPRPMVKVVGADAKRLVEAGEHRLQVLVDAARACGAKGYTSVSRELLQPAGGPASRADRVLLDAAADAQAGRW